jgi:uncharacterized damage-inducible protein DinB
MIKALNRLSMLAAASAIVLTVSAPAAAQDVMTKESVGELKTSFIADLNVMKDKFIGLAQAFPQDKYTWRPMEGVRSVSEVLMLAASEGYGFIPSGFGGKPDATPEQMKQFPSITDKAQVIDHLNKAFAHVTSQLAAIDNATLTGKRNFLRQDRSAANVALTIGGDLHEHLGQLIAYARMNHIVPPWSK